MKVHIKRATVQGLGAFLLLCSVALAGDDCTAEYGAGATRLVVATGSPGELGLLEALAESFNKTHDITLCWKKAGSGESLKMLKAGEADVVMVHAPDAEKKAVREGWAAHRTLIGSNEFYVVGPADDPAGVAGAGSAPEAFSRIAAARAPFLSRGDNSGTHKKEVAIWKAAGIAPGGDWYLVTHDFMTPTLKKANDVGGYFMTDSSTWLIEKKSLPQLKILLRGDPVLINTYHALCGKDGGAGARDAATAFVKFLASKGGQRIIGDYGSDTYGEPLYNDARRARKDDQ